MEEKIGGISIDEIVGAATDDLNGKVSQPVAQPIIEPVIPQPVQPVAPQPVMQASAFCPECGTPMTGDFCGNCGWSEKAMADTKTCANCGSPMAAEDIFCGECGWSGQPAAPMATPVASDSSVCENCGAPMMADEMFCGNCGWQVGTTVQKEFCPECGSVVVNGFCQFCQRNIDDNNDGWVQRFKDFRDGI